MDALGIQQAVLVGHSLVGIELSHFAVTHPERVLKLVYLDVAFPRNSEEYKALMAKNPLREVQPPGAEAVFSSADEYEASIRQDYPSLNAIWGPAMHEDYLHEIKFEADRKVVDRISDEIIQGPNETMIGYELDDARIQALVLSFFCLQDGHNFITDEWMTVEHQAQMVAWYFYFFIPLSACIND